ncbi:MULTISPECIES: hypothetical protein [unclassified Kitasatospora]|uniref:hypothetical protein n=1 Tax=unclassified Kitasatospora TaxID=2633591 RepID=UPI0034259515
MSLRRTALRIAAAAAAVSAIALPASAHATGLSTAGPAHATAADRAGFVMGKAQFDRMFPNRDRFYTYDALVGAMSAYPGTNLTC